MTATLTAATLVELQAALSAGAGAGEAVAATCTGGVLDGVARQARLGQPLSQLAAGVETGDPAADFLVRCLALTERTGGGGTEAVEHAVTAIREEAALERLLDVRTAQARGTAVILVCVPLVAWALLVALDPRALTFYATPVGAVTGVTAVGLAALAGRWMNRLTRATRAAGEAADPLAPSRPAPAWRRGTVASAVVAIPVGIGLGPVVAVLAGAAVLFGVARPRTTASPGNGRSGGAAETVSLVAVALDSGMAPATAFAEVAELAPPPAVELLRSAARRVAAGWRVDEALTDTPLETLGACVAAAHRWGAPAAPALRALAADLRADRRAAVELAAERLQLALIFPTTLLTLPAFVLGVVPPLLWSTVRG